MTAIKRKKIADLLPDPENARRHPERNLAAIRASLERFGQQKPIVVTPEGLVVAGNGTLEAAKALGWEALDVVVTDLPPKEWKAFALADNRTAELAEWDVEALASALSDVGDLSGIDFELPATGPATPPEEFKVLDESLAAEYCCPRCRYEWSGAPRGGSGS